MVSSISTNHLLQIYARRNDTAGNVQQPVQAGSVEQSVKGNQTVQVNLSEAARNRQAFSTAAQSYREQLQEAKKTRARERVAEVKRRLDELKRLVMMLGDLAPKALLRELKQLAGELKSAAKDLQESSTGSGFTANTTAISTGSEAEATVNTDIPEETESMEISEGDAVAATEQAQAEKVATAVGGQQQESLVNEKQRQEEKQRREDQQALAEALRELKLLFNMLKAMLRRDDKDDDTKKQLDDISKLINDTEKSAQQLTAGPALNISADDGRP